MNANVKRPRALPRRLGRWGAVAAAVLLATAAGCSRKGSAPAQTETRRIGVFQVTAESRPARPVVGDNRLVVTLHDASGKPVVGATIEMSSVMEAMGTMPRMQSRGVVTETRPGVYEIRYGLAMTGEWDLNLAIRAPEGAQAVASWRLSTSTDQLDFVAGTPPPGTASASGAPPDPGSAATGTVNVPGFGPVLLDETRRQSIGIRTTVAASRPIRATIRAAGKVTYDETRRSEVSLKFSGWVRRIHVNYPGQVVRQGEPLVSVYSPELFSAQQEFLQALRPVPSAGGGGMPGMGSGDTPAGGADPDLAAAARQRLRLWDITPGQIDAIARSGKPLEAVPILAPAGGVVVEKNVVEGSSFMAGQVLYKIAPIHPVWVVASVYQYELPLVRAGMNAVIQTPFLSERTRDGRVSYVTPYLDPSTRTGEVRVTVPNARGDLKPGMFVDVMLERDLGSRLAIPQSSVLYEGDRSIVFVDLGPAGFVPRQVALGAKAGDDVEVKAGLQPGDVVVTSGNFLIAAESKLKAATVNP
ncbi:MAG TPA: efflux RND transporter periplasmic adaptor subunit [Candidatus Eisenbacteria bacterium]|nr:efflux RND transporter periplasmic adaptor subunit [Candidatus Eisenbacteria bacterium]